MTRALLDARWMQFKPLIQGYHESPVRLVLKEISDIERVLSRVALGSARPRDLVQLRQACAQIPYLWLLPTAHCFCTTIHTHSKPE